MAHNRNIQNETILFCIKGNENTNILSQVYGKERCLNNFFFFRYVLIGRNATYPTDHTKLRSKLMQQASFPETTTAFITLPSVKNESISIYEQYVKRATVCKPYVLSITRKCTYNFINIYISLQTGGSAPNDMDIYKTYANQYKALMGKICSA